MVSAPRSCSIRAGFSSAKLAVASEAKNAPVSIAPAVLGLTGWVYGGTAITLGAIFLAMAVKVSRSRAEAAKDMAAEKQLFKFSLLYLACLFGALVADSLLLA